MNDENYYYDVEHPEHPENPEDPELPENPDCLRLPCIGSSWSFTAVRAS